MRVVDGPIGMKLSRLSRMLREIAPSMRRSTVALPEA